MTDSEKEIIRLLNEQNRLLRQLVEKDRPKYETKVVKSPNPDDDVWIIDPPITLEPLKSELRNINNNEKAEID